MKKSMHARDPSLDLKPRTGITRSPKQGKPWLPKKNSRLPFRLMATFHIWLIWYIENRCRTERREVESSRRGGYEHPSQCNWMLLRVKIKPFEVHDQKRGI